MIVKTTGLVLRYWPFSNTSRVVAWLTPDHGRVNTLIKGAQRPKSPFIGQFDLFYTCELLFYERSQAGLHIARECSPLEARSHLRGDYRATAAASYYADLAYRFSPPGLASSPLYDLLERQLDELARTAPRRAHLLWFELKLLDAAGFAPRLLTCPQCRCTTGPADAGHVFSFARGGVLCPQCAPSEPPPTLPVRSDVLATLLAWQRSAAFQAARNTRLSPLQQEHIHRLLGGLLEHQLEHPLKSRAVAAEILA